MSTVTIRPLREDDAEALLQFELENRAFFEKGVPSRGDSYYSLENLRALLLELEEEQESGICFMYLIHDPAGEIVGRINLFSIVRGDLQKAELGYRVGERHNGKGYATQAIRLALREAFGVHKLHRVEASTAPDNIGSQVALIKNGFQFVGRSEKYMRLKGRWVDSIHFAILAPDDPA